MTLLLMSLMANFAVAAPSGQDIADAASWHLQHLPTLNRNDCSGLVESVFDKAGMAFPGNTASFWAEAERWGKTHKRAPKPGDLAFFDYTYDKNGNDRVDDALTHIAVVRAVEADGTIVMVHKGGKGITELRLNLDKPEVHIENGKVLNSYLRARDYGIPEGPRMAGQLVRGFATMTADSGGSAEATPEDSGRPKQARSILVEAYGSGTSDALDQQQSALTGTKAANLGELSCEELWRVRNTVFARHGYAFGTDKARVYFGLQEWYQRNPLITQDTVDRHLTRSDRKNVERVLKAEEKAGCN